MPISTATPTSPATMIQTLVLASTSPNRPLSSAGSVVVVVDAGAPPPATVVGVVSPGTSSSGAVVGGSSGAWAATGRSRSIPTASATSPRTAGRVGTGLAGVAAMSLQDGTGDANATPLTPGERGRRTAAARRWGGGAV